MKNPLLSCPYVVTKRKLCQNYTICSRKVNRMPFFFRFVTKNQPLSCPYCVKKRQISKKTQCSHAYFLSKKCQLSQKHCALISFFSFHEKPPAVMPILGQKNVNSDKTTKCYGPKKSIGCRIFFKNVYFHKNTAFIRVFCQKNVYSLKTQCCHVICFYFFTKNPLLSCPNFVQKTSILSKLHCLWANKFNRMPFFSDFLRKNTALMPIFSQKNVNSLKNTLLSCPYFVKKRLFSQNYDALMSFFLIFFLTQCCHSDIW